MIGALLGGAAIGAAGQVIGGVLNAKQAEKDRKAAAAAAAQRQQVAGQVGADALTAGQNASNMIGAGAQQGTLLQDRAGSQAQGYLQGGIDSATGAVNNAAGSQLAALGQGYGQATGALGTANTAATGALNQGYGQAQGTLGGLAGLGKYGEQAVQGRIGDNFQTDPGYQFRLQQGQQALDRSQSAAGGRLSGAALKAMSNYNQGMASQEFGNAANRDLQMRQMQANLGQAGYQASGQLAGMQAGQGNALAGQANQYGSGLAGLATGYGQDQSGVYGNKGSQLSNIAMTGSGRQAGQAQTTGDRLSDLATGSAGARAGLLTGATQQAGGAAMWGAGGPPVPANQSNGIWSGVAQGLGQLGAQAGMMGAMGGGGGGGGNITTTRATQGYGGNDWRGDPSLNP